MIIIQFKSTIQKMAHYCFTGLAARLQGAENSAGQSLSQIWKMRQLLERTQTSIADLTKRLETSEKTNENLKNKVADLQSWKQETLLCQQMKKLLNELLLFQSEEIKGFGIYKKAQNGWGMFDYNPHQQDVSQDPNHHWYCINRKVNLANNHKKILKLLTNVQLLNFSQIYLNKLNNWKEVFEKYTENVIKDKFSSNTAKGHVLNQIKYRNERIAEINEWISDVKK